MPSQRKIDSGEEIATKEKPSVPKLNHAKLTFVGSGRSMDICLDSRGTKLIWAVGQGHIVTKVDVERITKATGVLCWIVEDSSEPVDEPIPLPEPPERTPGFPIQYSDVVKGR